MQNKSLHIVSFDNPYPPVYGGIVEVYSKLKPLHELGVDIYLHCFVDVVPECYDELQSHCKQVFFYKIDRNPLHFFQALPFSMLARTSTELLRNLQINDAPILFEGLKTAYWICQHKLPHRRKILRVHNIEHDYFRGLSSSETSIFKKMVYAIEARKFAAVEKVIARFENVVALSNFEHRYVASKFGNAAYIPVFHGNQKVEPLDGLGKYALYHGDLRLSDNLRVACSLVKIFRAIPDFELVIAGNANQDVIRAKIGDAANIKVVPIENFETLKTLLRDAHVNLIFSYQRSGTKLKLMTALFNSRFCIINANIMDDPHVSDLCEHANTDAEIKAKVMALKNTPFDEYAKRRDVLENYMSDFENAQLLMDEIWA